MMYNTFYAILYFICPTSLDLVQVFKLEIKLRSHWSPQGVQGEMEFTICFLNLSSLLSSYFVLFFNKIILHTSMKLFFILSLSVFSKLLSDKNVKLLRHTTIGWTRFWCCTCFLNVKTQFWDSLQCFNGLNTKFQQLVCLHQWPKKSLVKNLYHKEKSSVTADQISK